MKNFQEFVDLLNTDETMAQRKAIIESVVKDYTDEEGKIDASDTIPLVYAQSVDTTLLFLHKYHEWINS